MVSGKSGSKNLEMMMNCKSSAGRASFGNQTQSHRTHHCCLYSDITACLSDSHSQLCALGLPSQDDA
jgi:hypothetical protein